jgi:hypothetical protein
VTSSRLRFWTEIASVKVFERIREAAYQMTRKHPTLVLIIIGSGYFE